MPKLKDWVYPAFRLTSKSLAPPPVVKVGVNGYLLNPEGTGWAGTPTVIVARLMFGAPDGHVRPWPWLKNTPPAANVDGVSEGLTLKVIVPPSLEPNIAVYALKPSRVKAFE